METDASSFCTGFAVGVEPVWCAPLRPAPPNAGHAPNIGILEAVHGLRALAGAAVVEHTATHSGLLLHRQSPHSQLAPLALLCTEPEEAGSTVTAVHHTDAHDEQTTGAQQVSTPLRESRAQPSRLFSARCNLHTTWMSALHRPAPWRSCPLPLLTNNRGSRRERHCSPRPASAQSVTTLSACSSGVALH